MSTLMWSVTTSFQRAIAMMTPFLQILEQQQERQQEEKRVMVAKMERMNRQCIENKLDSNANSYPLVALTMAQQKHALAGLPCNRLQ
ncbi:TPA: hypothetical protein ACH3X1_000022 [Trebouxia sp. C0004]